MKRSEMVEIIEESIIFTGASAPLKEISLIILEAIEQAGMLPPKQQVMLGEINGRGTYAEPILGKEGIIAFNRYILEWEPEE